jgi:phospholipid/cholesterol/gamma-HCH transport system substrate-binding protein
MSDYETIQKRRNIIVGIFVLIGLVAFVWMIFKFGDLPLFVTEIESYQVYVQFPSAPGVAENTPVRLAGYQVGRVTEVMPPQELEDLRTHLKYYQAVVVLSIKKQFINIPSNVEVKLMTRGLGSSYLELKINPQLPITPLDPNKPATKYLADGMRLEGSTGMTSEFFPEESQKKLDDLITNLSKLIANANDIVGNQENKDNINKSLANLTDATREAAKALVEFQKFAASGTNTSAEISKAVTQLRLVLEKINNGEGTTGRLVNDAKLYDSLVEDARQLKLMMDQVRTTLEEWQKKGVPLKMK